MPRSIKEAWEPVAYNKRDILQVDGDVSKWTEEDIPKELEHNRVLQKGFATRPATEIIADMKLTKQIWLSDFICPKLEHAIRINIAARVATLYKVAPENFHEITEKIYQTLDSAFHQEVQQLIDAEMAPLRARTEKDWLRNEDGTPTFGDQLNPVYNQLTEDGKKLLQALIRTRLDQTQRQIGDDILSAKLKMHCNQLEKEKNPIIIPKQLASISKDYLVLGAAGSGKSTILTDKKIDESNAILISTDNYRAIQFNNIDSKLSNQQVFIKTQDTAYMIKERVADIIKKEVMASEKRPPIILDVVTIEPWMMSIAANPKTEAVIACLGTAKEIASRVWDRAENPNSSAADKNRHVNSTLLFKGHSYGSDILAIAPKHNNIALYNTNTPDRIPVKIATLDTINNKMAIYDLNQIGQFLGKKNLNTEATSEADLFTHTKFKTDRYQYKSRHQACCILSLLKPHSNPRAQGPLSSISLQKDGLEYAKIEKNTRGQIQFVVSDLNHLKKALGDKKDKLLILELLVQTSVYNAKRGYLGNKVVYEKVMQAVMKSDMLEPPEDRRAPTPGMR